MRTLKQQAPHRVKVAGRRVSVAVGERTAGLRMSPTFILAGAQRCGTTSLFRALMDHPAILPPVHHKGINYFDVGYENGARWYRGHFPLRARAAALRHRAGEDVVTFEASGYYSFHPHAPARIGADLPGVKIIMMVRDPVARAYSAYRHELARGFETESFDRAVELEDSRVEPDLARMLSDPTYHGFSYRHHAYRRRGMYAEQLERLSGAVGRDRVHVVDSEDFFSRPEQEYDRVVAFLGLRDHRPRRFDQWNARPGSAMSDTARTFLEAAFSGPDGELEAFTGRVPSWRRGGGPA